MSKENESESGKSPSTFKVQDRRRFDAEGNSVASAETASPEAPSKPPPPVKEHPPEEFKPEVFSQDPQATDAGYEDMAPTDDGSVATFSGFVMSFATQALMQMGEMDPPPGMGIDIDLAGAQQTIDILTMLQNKTKGNLSAAETRLMEDILHNLRITFVRQSRS